MFQTLLKNWWLLVLCGVLDAIYSVINLLMQDPDGSLTLRKFAVRSTVVLLGKIAVAAGACTIAAGIWNSGEGKSWLLVLNGLALSAFGLIFTFWKGRLSFLSVALLFVVMAMSLGIFAWRTALIPRRHVRDRWALVLAAAAWIGFALVFVALAFGWIKPDQPESLFVWMSSYFGFSAVCMVGLGLRLHSVGMNINRMAIGVVGGWVLRP